MLAVLADVTVVDAGIDASVDATVIPDAALPDASVEAPVDAPIDAAVDAAAPASVIPAPSRREDAAWLLVGGALTFITTGIVLAYAADSAETDIDDLYVSLDGKPPVFDDKTKARYDELVKEGTRYEHLSWVSFGLAGGMAIGATIMFWKHRTEEPRVAPVVTTNGAGVRVRF